MAEHSEAISTLNTIIATTIDSITGYEDSAQNIDNEQFREIFRRRANERQEIVEQLRAEVRRLGGNPEDDGSFLGKAHQRFEDLKAAITGHVDEGSQLGIAEAIGLDLVNRSARRRMASSCRADRDVLTF